MLLVLALLLFALLWPLFQIVDLLPGDDPS